jgi:hydrogenase-4 component B
MASLLLAGLGLIVAGGALSTRGWNGLYRSLVLLGCALAAAAPIGVLITGRSVTLAIPATTPGGAWIVGVDALSAVFLLVILAIGAACATYGVGYIARTHAANASRFAHLAFAVLVASIALVVVAQSVVLFLVAWELMAISSYVLIVTDYERADVRRAGLIYLVATHTATLALFAMFAAWIGDGGDWSFAELARATPLLGAGAQSAIPALALVGFGFKAGVVPLHIWLPPAHAAAPSHVSALMSGVVIKTGVYGLLRVVIMLGGAPAWWGWTILALGCVSAVLGVLWALAQHDIKRLLAYHSVENIGIILIGIGLGVLGVAYAMPVVATLGFGGAILHTVNHALFKSVLFLGAGSVYCATGTRDIDSMGGLAQRMPATWFAFLVGAAAIVGLPPLNGFVSEWVIYQGLFTGAGAPGGWRFAAAAVAALALTGALALACFVKVAGIAFLGTPRTPAAGAAREVDAGMLAPAWTLAAACITLGLVPMTGLMVVGAATDELAGAPQARALTHFVSADAWTVTLFAALLVGVTSALWLARRALLRSKVTRHEVTWACGYPATDMRTQYTGSSFAAPLLSVFGRVSGVQAHGVGIVRRTHATDLVLDGVVEPAWRALGRATARLRPLQHGRLHIYLLYVMAALVALLAYLALAPGP